MKKPGVLIAVCGVIAMLAFPALAGEGKASLPQLDVERFPGLLFWLAVTFPALFVLMRFVALPNLEQAQSKRQAILRADLEAAEADNKKAAETQEAYEKALAEARAKARESIEEIMKSAAAEEDEKRAVQQQEINRRIAEAEERITAFRKQAAKEGREAAADLAGAIVERLLGSAEKKRGM